MQIAQPTSTAFGDHDFLAIVGEVGDYDIVGQVLDDGTNRHAQDNVVGTASVTIGAATDFAILGPKDARETIVDERIDVDVGDDKNRAAFSAVTAVGPAERDVFLAAH